MTRFTSINPDLVVRDVAASLDGHVITFSPRVLSTR